MKLRVKDKHSSKLDQMAREVNFVWNYCNDLSYSYLQRKGEWLSAYDIEKYTKGSSKLMLIDSTAIQEISKEYVTRRKQCKKAKLNWRKSYGARRSLGWIPFKKGAAQWKQGQVKYAGFYFKVWDSYDLSKFEFRSGRFNQDARGRWYFNVVVEVQPKTGVGTQSVGIDLGCKEAATDSNGDGVTGRRYRALEKKLGIAQRAKQKKHLKNIHAKIKNRRQDDLHQYSRKLVNQNAAIFVGNLSSQAMTKTKLAKSALDAGWGMLKTMLTYKCDHAGIVFEEVNEAYSTQRCSICQVIPDSSPKGRAALGIREWTCSECGAEHDRDMNAARNILALGHERLAGANFDAVFFTFDAGHHKTFQL